MNILIRSSSGITQLPLETRLMADQRRIFVEGEINAGTADEFFKEVLYLNHESSEPISVFINSPGGEINSGLLMYDVITGSPAPIRMNCMGRAASMAAILFASAGERYLLPGSELMIHQPLLGNQVSGNASSLKSISDSLLETKAQMNRILAKHTGKSEAEIDEATSFDHYFSAEEAVAFHLADRIVDFKTMTGG